MMVPRERFKKAAPVLLAKAINLFAEGKIAAVDVAKVEAKLHQIELSIR
jgi:hypothetical protein